ncbi:hypothetical protein DRQ50_00585 [bacterium]|nr:MAG: hypothetical protein DRQ50_00585 [bacterium]
MGRKLNSWCCRDLTLERAGTAMAYRRGLLDRRALRLAGVVMTLGVGLTVALLVTVQVTILRAEVAALEDHQECLLARAAGLEAAWTTATDRQAVRKRARSELDLVAPEDPDFVLVVPSPDPATGPWQRLLANLGAGDRQTGAATPVRLLAGAMVSLQPRAASAATGSGGME